MQEDKLILGGHAFSSRFILGSGKYSLPLIKAAAEQAGAQIITLALRRAQSQQDNILDFIPAGLTLLPNTSGARTADEAVRIAHLAPWPAAVVILSSWRSFGIPSIYCPTIRPLSKQRRY